MTEPKHPPEDSTRKGQSLDWERDLLARLAFAALNEQRRTRRWNIFFRSLLLLLLLAFVLYLPESREAMELGQHTAVVDIEGIIAPETNASADNIITGLRSAFESKNTVGVILRINSPGGSPVQAGYVNDEIRRLREKYPDTPVYAVITDICASGGYYVAAAADKIFANKASLVGSIGVLMNGFGFVETLDKLGVERRLLTAGEHKGFLDPFSPQRQDDVQHVQGLLDDIHQQFIQVVQDGRGGRLAKDADLFSGYVWTGEKGIELGLIDELGSSSYVAREVIGQKRLVDFTHKESYFDRFAERLGSAIASALVSRLALQRAALQ